MHWRFLALAVALCFVGPLPHAWAERAIEGQQTVVVELVPSRGPSPSAAPSAGGAETDTEDRVVLRLEDLATGEDFQRLVSRPGTAPVSTTFTVPPATYRVSVAADGSWAPERIVAPREQAGPIEIAIPLFPTGLVTGRVVAPEGERDPDALEASFRFPVARGAREASRFEAGTVACDLEGRDFRCRVPVGVLDFRLDIDGFAPVYRWGWKVESGRAASMERLELVRGASVSGTVLQSGSLAPVPGATVELRPTGLTGDRDPVNRERARVRRQRVATDGRGFFQLSGTPRGAYDVWISGDGVAEGKRTIVEVAEDREYRLEDPLLVAPPTALEILLTPPLDPYGRPWLLRLARHLRGVEYESVRGVPPEAAPSGAWTADGLVPGHYMVRIGNELDPSWHMERFEMGSEDELLQISLDVVAVDGELTLGGEPMAATLWFGGRHGEESVRFDADLDGEFRGFLPREGEWRVELSRVGWHGAQALDPVIVERSSGQPVARLRIELPDTTLRGKVIDEEGTLQPLARLLAVSMEEASRELMELADEEGGFEFRGLSPATLRVQAESEAGVSDWTAVRLEDGREGPDVVLRVAQRRQLRGRVISSSGPIADATVTIIPAFTSAGPAAVVETSTAVDGTFEAGLPGHVHSVNLLVLPPGFAAKLVSHSLRGGAGEAGSDPLEIQVSEAGGTLELIPDAGTEEAAPPGLLMAGGAMVGIEYFSSWSRLRGEPFLVDGRYRIPSIESGSYRLCSRSVLAPGDGEGVAPCDQGYLAVGGELILSIRSHQESTR